MKHEVGKPVVEVVEEDLLATLYSDQVGRAALWVVCLRVFVVG